MPSGCYLFISPVLRKFSAFLFREQGSLACTGVQANTAPFAQQSSEVLWGCMQCLQSVQPCIRVWPHF